MKTITMPQAGQSMEEGTIVRWCKSEGDQVAKGDILLEIETDKATVEVEATDAGTLRKIIADAGQTLPVHAPIALIGTPKEKIEPALAEAKAALAALTGEGAAPVPQSAPAPAPAAPAAAAKIDPSKIEVTVVVMPQAGQSMEEGTIVKWRVEPGQRINKGDIIFDVETDKAVVEVEATDAGRLARIVVAEGGVCPVKQPVAYLAENDADVDAWLAAGGDEFPAVGGEAHYEAPAPPAVTVAVGETIHAEMDRMAKTVAPGDRIPASPAARKLAAERGVELAAIGNGRGPNGRILSTDVAAVAAVATGASPVMGKAATPAAPAWQMPAGPIGQPTRRKMSGMRKAIARNLVASKQNIPHFYMKLTIDAEPLSSFYRAQKAQYPLSINDAIILACARVIHEFPTFKCRVDGEELVELPTANIGMAVGMDDGLVVPVIMAAERLTLRQLAAESKRLAETARKGKIENMGQGVFTISNLGMFGVEEFSAIINPPEAAILAVSGIREAVVVKNGMMRPGRVMTMTLSSDHRIVDGLLAAKFVARLKEVLEAPEQLA